MIHPKESAHFRFFAPHQVAWETPPVQASTVEPLESSPTYLGDWVGLRTLHTRGSLHRCPGARTSQIDVTNNQGKVCKNRKCNFILCHFMILVTVFRTAVLDHNCQGFVVTFCTGW